MCQTLWTELRELKGDINKSTTAVEEFNIPLLTTDRTLETKSARI